MSLTRETSRCRSMAHRLGRVAAMWLDGKDPVRQEAILALQVSTGFSGAMIDEALRSAFEELTEEKILAFCAENPVVMHPAYVPAKVLHILAGNVFTAWLPGATLSLLLGAEVHLKPSMQEPVFAALWKRSLGEVDSALAEKVQVVAWDDTLLNHYPSVVAYGSDETLYALKKKVTPATRWVGYGHKQSVAVIWQEALSVAQVAELVDRLERDIRPFDLKGCLSPQFVFIEGEDPGIFEGLFARLNTLPVFKRFDTWEDLKSELRDLQPTLSTLGVAGPQQRTAALQPEWDALGFSRVCSVGQMQKPALNWKNGGLSLVDALTSR